MEKDKKYTVIHYLFIIIFAILFDFSIIDGFRVVIQKFLKIPNETMELVLWGDTFFLRIIVSVLGTAAASFAIGTYLNKNYKTVSLLALIPKILIFIVNLGFGLWLISTGNDLQEIKNKGLVLSAILIFLLPIVAVFFSTLGNTMYRPQDSFSVFSIKWYHWFWIFMLFLRNIIAIVLFFLIVLWKFDLTESNIGFFDIFSDLSYFILRIIIVTMLIIVCLPIVFIYGFVVSDVVTDTDYNLINKLKSVLISIIIIFSYMFLYNILFAGINN
jgi:hypothetical protein